jgi:hypothetical protein
MVQNVTKWCAVKPRFNRTEQPRVFEQLPQILKHVLFFVRARAIGEKELPGTGPMLVPSLPRYQACPLSKPEIDPGRNISPDNNVLIRYGSAIRNHV